MAAFIIEGGHPLSGEIQPQGAKNEALQVICATLLTSEKVTIHNIPQIRDVMTLIQLLKDVGVKVAADGNTYTFQADELNLDYLQSNEFVQKCAQLRGSVMMIGPLLARMGKATIAKPGGDKIGRRRLDTHFLGFERLGAQFHHVAERDVYEIQAQQLKGCYMLLDEASVTGTANIVMAAVMAKGTTTIYNAACEPYLQQLCKMLNKMGARISGIASNLLTIEGVDHLNGTEHTILPDMIEVGSFIGMAAMVGNGIRIKDVSIKDLGIIPNTFRRMGITIKEDVYRESYIISGLSKVFDMKATYDLGSGRINLCSQAVGTQGSYTVFACAWDTAVGSLTWDTNAGMLGMLSEDGNTITWSDNGGYSGLSINAFITWYLNGSSSAGQASSPWVWGNNSTQLARWNSFVRQ